MASMVQKAEKPATVHRPTNLITVRSNNELSMSPRPPQVAAVVDTRTITPVEVVLPQEEQGDRRTAADRLSAMEIREREPHATAAYPKTLMKVHDEEIAEKLNLKQLERVLPEGHIECPFMLLGCTFAGPIVKVQKHIRDDKMLHLTQMCDNVMALQREVQVEIENANRFLALDEALTRRAQANDKLYSCQMIWRIDDYTQHYKRARDGKKPLLFSRPFYSHCNGYKLVCILAPYGDGEGVREYVSVFLSVARGDNDGMLAWPYRCPVTFTLMHQKNGEHVSATLVPKPVPANEPFLGRPTADRNPAFGLQKFIKLNEMRNGGGFVVYDTCFLKVDVNIADTFSA